MFWHIWRIRWSENLNNNMESSTHLRLIYSTTHLIVWHDAVKPHPSVILWRVKQTKCFRNDLLRSDFEPVCLTCHDVFKGPNKPPVPSLSPVSQIVGVLFLCFNPCPSASLLSLSVSSFPSWTWSTNLLTLTRWKNTTITTNKLKDKL